MKTFLTLIGMILLSVNISFAQCGRRVAQPQVELRQKSSLIIPVQTENLKKLASISKKEAKKIATSKYPGKVKEAGLITEEGALVWKLEVRGTEGQKELFIDPANGNFLGFGLTK